tara:strand:+ start:234 stop:551 length:318 start_codon:yes stop_codon:yes gene_type:complete
MDSDSGTSVLEEKEVKLLPPFNVILVNDEEHTYEYVIEMLMEIFSYDKERSFKLAEEVNDEGRAVVATTHKEFAELRREQIQSFGKDPRVDSCKGSMTAEVEPVR